MKIALCFCGQARSFAQGYDYYKKHLLQSYDVDVYIHTWKMKSGEQALLDLYKPKKYIIEEPLTNLYVDIDRKYTNTPTPHKWPSRFTYSALYSMKKVSTLIDGNYDWIIKSRTDYALNGFIPFSAMSNSKLYIPDCRMVPSKDFGNDQFAFSSQQNMMKYMSTFDNIDEYYEAGNQFVGEDMMRANLHKHMLYGENLEYVHMNNPFPPGPHNGTWHSLIRDDYEQWTRS